MRASGRCHNGRQGQQPEQADQQPVMRRHDHQHECCRQHLHDAAGCRQRGCRRQDQRTERGGHRHHRGRCDPLGRIDHREQEESKDRPEHGCEQRACAEGGAIVLCLNEVHSPHAGRAQHHQVEHPQGKQGVHRSQPQQKVMGASRREKHQRQNRAQHGVRSQAGHSAVVNHANALDGHGRAGNVRLRGQATGQGEAWVDGVHGKRSPCTTCRPMDARSPVRPVAALAASLETIGMPFLKHLTRKAKCKCSRINVFGAVCFSIQPSREQL